MSMSDMEFRAVLLDQMKDYLDGRITKEEYYDQAEPFYTEYANTYENPLFHKCFMDTVPENLGCVALLACQNKRERKKRIGMILSILVYTFFSRMFDLMLPPVAKHSIVVA